MTLLPLKLRTHKNYSLILQNTRTVAKDKSKTPIQLERYFKGVANHHRITILLLVAKQKGITLDEIAQSLEINFKTISEHTQKLAKAGLLEKKYIKTSVAHSLSPYGIIFVRFIRTF